MKDKYLQFLCERITNLQTAIFTGFNTSLLRFPADIVDVTCIDKEGNLWFQIRNPYMSTEDFEKSFSAQLHFYNRNFNYHISVYGTATIVANRAGDNLIPVNFANTSNRFTILSFKISHAEYFYRKTDKSYFKTFIDNMISTFSLTSEPVLYKF